MFYDKSYHQQVLYQHQANAVSAVHHHQQQQQQQQQQQFGYDALRDWQNLAHQQRQPAQLQQQRINQQQLFPQQAPPPLPPSHYWPTSTRVQMSAQRPYSGVEQLLMAAMIEGNYPHHSYSTNNNNIINNTAPRDQHAHHSHQIDNSEPSHSPPPATLPPASIQPALSASSAPPPPLPPSLDDFLPTGRGLGYRTQQILSDEIHSIPAPRNSSELSLYRLLESANLLNYFGTFLHFGGDDVQQLSDADEDEFMEIMDLVGMNKKPLHIRRLQRALANWRRNQKEDKSEEIICENFKRPKLDTNMSNLALNRCSSPCDSRRSIYTSATIDTSHPPTPRSTSSQSFLMVPDEPLRDSRSFTTEDNLTNQELNYPRPNVLVNAPKRIRLFNPTQMNRNQCKTT